MTAAAYQDRCRLRIIEPEAFHQCRLRLVFGTDNGDDFIQIEKDNKVTFEYIKPCCDLPDDAVTAVAAQQDGVQSIQQGLLGVNTPGAPENPAR